MKNACMLLRKNVNALPDDGATAVLDELFLNGYAFDELRILSEYNEQTVKDSIASLRQSYQNVFVVANQAALPLIKALFSMGITQGNIHDDGQTVVCFLSEDCEGKEYVKNVCVPYLQQKYGIKTDRIVLRSIGAGSVHVENLLAEAKRLGGGNICLNHLRKYDEDIIELIYDNHTPKMLVDELLRLFAEGLDGTMYALDDIPIENQLVTLLKLRGKKLSVAESFTGGGLARRIVSVSGASEVYFEGLNTYDERSKMKRLGVSSYTLGSLGAVSEKTAYEMALGLLNTGDCDIAISTTGLAGPKTDRSLLPVGLCYIAVGTKERICVYQYRFDGSRKDITEKAINYALFQAYKMLKQ